MYVIAGRRGATWRVENIKGETVYTIERRGNHRSRIHFVLRPYKRGQITSRIDDFPSLEAAKNAARKLLEGESN